MKLYAVVILSHYNDAIYADTELFSTKEKAEKFIKKETEKIVNYYDDEWEVDEKPTAIMIHDTDYYEWIEIQLKEREVDDSSCVTE